MNRRALLTAIGTSTFALAGCVGDELDDDGRMPGAGGGGGGDDDGDDGNAEDDATDGDDGTEDDRDGSSPDATVRQLGASCASGDEDWAVVVRDDDELVITGTTPASNPCHEAVLDELDRQGDALTVVIGVESTLEEDEDCAQCVGAIAYEATVQLDASTLDAVEVDHREGKRHRPDVHDAGTTPSVAEQAIETLGTACGETDTVGVDGVGPTVRVHGTIPAPTPCHEAELVSAEVDDDTLALTIDVTPDESGESCVECLGEIEYEARIELAGPPEIDTVQVQHVGYSAHATSWANDREG